MFCSLWQKISIAKLVVSQKSNMFHNFFSESAGEIVINSLRSDKKAQSCDLILLFYSYVLPSIFFCIPPEIICLLTSQYVVILKYPVFLTVHFYVRHRTFIRRKVTVNIRMGVVFLFLCQNVDKVYSAAGIGGNLWS